jgi:hypothetical protein
MSTQKATKSQKGLIEINQKTVLAAVGNKGRMVTHARSLPWIGPKYFGSRMNSIHAESLVSKNTKNTNGLTIYVVRPGMKGTSRPCYHCIMKLKKTNFKYIVYTVDGVLRKERMSALNNFEMFKLSSGERW